MHAVMTVAFAKMHGLGNDFAIVDARRRPLTPAPAQVARLADRRTGIGFDQLILLDPGDGTVDVRMRIFNRDGSAAEACGNAARCIGRLLAAEHPPETPVRIGTAAGAITARVRTDGPVTVELGPPALDWKRIPLAAPRDTLDLGLVAGPLRGGTAVNVGNPHVVFVTDRLRDIDLAGLGPSVECDPLFPERANVGLICKDRSAAPEPGGRDRILMRVWERGAGLTRACGTGACAALVAAHRLGLCGRSATVGFLDGGQLDIEWKESDGRLRMTGDAALSFRGQMPEECLR